MLSKPKKVELYFIIWQLSLQKLDFGDVKCTHPSMQLVQFSCQTETIIFLGESNMLFFFFLPLTFSLKKKDKMLFSFCDFWKNALMPIKL